MRVLITGAQGQLGSELQAALACGRTDLGPIPAEYQSATVLLTDADTLDITDREQVERYFAANKPEIVFNCAAFTDVDACESQVERSYQINVEGPRVLAEACEKAQAVLVHISSDYVFGGDDPSPRCEQDSVAPRTVYGEHKLVSEHIVAASCTRSVIVRTAWLYGCVGNNFVRTILRLAHENAAIKVVNDQWGTPTNAKDLVHELLRLALSGEYGVFHCTGKGSCSWFEFACAIVDEAQIPCEKAPCTTTDFPRPAQRPAYSVLDNARLRATIGDEMRPWPVALASFMEQL